MSLKHGLLGLLNYGSMTGYELHKAFKNSLSFFWQAQPSQIYRELGAMEQNGWLTSRRVIQTEKPNKRIFSITPAGKTELQRWLSSPQADIRDAMQSRSAFLMRVFFAGETSDAQALSMLRDFRESCLEAMAAFQSAGGSIQDYEGMVEDARRTKYWRIAAMFGDSFLRTELEWAEKAIGMLEGKA